MLLYVHLRNEHSSQYLFCFQIYGIQNKNTQLIYANWNIKEKESHNYLMIMIKSRGSVILGGGLGGRGRSCP